MTTALQLSLYTAIVIHLTSSQPTYDVSQQENDVTSCGSSEQSEQVLRQLVTVNSQLVTAVTQAQETNSDLVVAVKQLQKNHSQLVTAMQQAQVTNSDLVVAVKQLQSNSSQLVTAVTQAQVTNSGLVTAMARLRANVAALETANSQLQRDVAALKAAIVREGVGECRPTFRYISSVNSYYIAVNRNLNWTDAALECRTLHSDAHLLVINSAREQSAVAGLLTSITSNGKTLAGCSTHAGEIKYWTAGQRIDPSRQSTFVWRVITTGASSGRVTTMTYTNWRSGEPNYAGHAESCVEMWAGDSYKWNDGHCGLAHCFVCERNA